MSKAEPKTMQMLERYLQAIEFWLPREQRRDILAEISEDLHSRVDEQQTQLGRTLTEDELEALLKQRGRPVLVANRYQPQRSLIGPIWFPAYVFALKVVGVCYMLPWLVVYVVISRMLHPDLVWGRTLLAAWETIWTVAFVAAGTVTLIFAILEFTQAQTGFLQNWSPRKLPPVRDPYRIKRSTSIAEIALSLFFVLWWMAYASSPVMLNGPDLKVALTPDWMYFFWAYLAVGFSNIALSIANLRHPYWTSPRAACRLLSDLVGGGLVCLLLKANLLSTLFIANLDPARTLAIKNAIQFWMERCFPISIVIALIPVAIDLFRILRVSRRGEQVQKQWA